MKTKVGVILSGCGFLDGSEIHESVLTLLALDELGAEAVCMAPRGLQLQVVDHASGEPQGGASRDVLSESARIARGHIVDVATVRVAQLDAVVLPGGFGAAKNLCNFASKGAAAVPHGDVARLLREMHAAGKPIGAICIAPALVAATLGRHVHPTLTIGNDAGTAKALVAMGATHRDCPVTECVIDQKNRIVTAPAYMYDARIVDVAAGIKKLVAVVMGMAAEGGAVAGRTVEGAR
ncbi:MAG: isoprenoid biosynthesis glyoxalase ElbB [Planctomycetota bacterium]